MKQIVILRFGDRPNPAVTEALMPHMAGQSIALPVPGAIMSIIQTESSVDQVTEALKQVGVFFFCFERKDSGSQLPPELAAAIETVLETPRTPVPREWSVDEILDLISQHGIESLTPEQRAILERGSRP